MVRVGVLVIVLAVIAFGGVVWYRDYKKYAIPKNERQAVFLTNGQVYFGNLTHVDSNFVVLTDVYYLQQNEQLQTGQDASKTVNVIKLGQELQGPEDILSINREQVLFYEDMRNDSKVSQAIQDYINSTKK